MPSVPPPETQSPLPDPSPVSPRALPEHPEEPPRDEPPWPIWTAPAAIGAGFGLGIVVSVIIGIAAKAGGSSLSNPSPAVSLIGDFFFDAAFVAAALYFVRTTSHPRPEDFGYRPVKWRTGVAAVFVAGISYYVLTAVYASLLNFHGNERLPKELNVTKGAAVVGLAVFVCVVAPIAEEFFFRGFIFGALRRMRIRIVGREMGTWVAAIITAILFGLAHAGSASPRYLIPLGFLGFVLCLLRWRTRSLYPCMALHSINNSLALGISQLHWTGGEILALMVGGLVVIGALTAPLANRVPAVT
jgi:CAAX protease family protein